MRKRKLSPPLGSRGKPRRTWPKLRVSAAGLARVGLALLWLGSFGAMAYGLHRLEPHARAVYAETPVRLEWEHLPTWLADPAWKPELDEIERTADLLSDDDIFAPGLCERVGLNLSRSAWVAQVHRVSKRPDGVVRVRATFRKPLTLVEYNGVAYRVAEDGTRLPGAIRADFLSQREGLVVSGVQGQPPAEGVVWPGADLAAGLKLVDYLNRAAVEGRLPCMSSLRRVDVSSFTPQGGPLRIATIHPNSFVIWGLLPGEEYDIEGTAERKLTLLAALYAEHGQIPDADWIDLRDKDRVRIGGRR